MTRQTIVVCDGNAGLCKQPATNYRVWHEGDSTATSIDLCDEHAAPLVAVLQAGTEVALPSRPRSRMEVTRLKTTAKTSPLKKKG